MALGKLRMPLSKRQYFVVVGGPFVECPDNMQGVKMAAEVNKPCAVDIPTVDYNVPDRKVLAQGLNKALDLMLAGEPLYVGCYGGKGRTGLFMAVLAKAFGVEKPVEYVRKNYYSHAVETPQQYEYVTNFVITPTMKRKIRWAKMRMWFVLWKQNLTRTPKVPKVKATAPGKLPGNGTPSNTGASKRAGFVKK